MFKHETKRIILTMHKIRSNQAYLRIYSAQIQLNRGNKELQACGKGEQQST